MTDRELLEAAARAAGLKIDKSPHNGGGHGNTGFDMTGDAMLDWHNNKRWNPLRDDGDALRLAVKLQFEILIEEEFDEIWCTVSKFFGPKLDDGICINEVSLGDPNAATRRAIVRAAAEIGKAMQ